MDAIEIRPDTMAVLVAVAKKLNERRADVVLELAVQALVDKINTNEAIEGNKKFIDQIENWILHPSSFEGANAIFSPPVGKTENEVYSLIAARIKWDDGPAILSCWKPTSVQIDRLKETGRLWLVVMGSGMVPVCVCSENPLLFDGIELQ